LDGEILGEEYLKIISEKPSSEVFKIDEINAAKDLKQNTLEFKLKVANMRTDTWHFTTLDDKLAAVKAKAEDANISDEIANIAMAAIRKVNQE
jgi:hypothetical protein